MAKILPLFSTVPRVPKVRHSDVKTDAECECPSKNGGHIDTVSLSERVVKSSGEPHGWMDGW